MSAPPSPDLLAAWVQDARRRTLELIADLDDAQLLGPSLAIVNPPLWEIGHVGWFQEKWVLRRPDRPSLRPDADALYDSAGVAHDTRWSLRLPSIQQTLRYLADVEAQVLDRLAHRPTPDDVYFTLLTVFHERSPTPARRSATPPRASPAASRRTTATSRCRAT